MWFQAAILYLCATVVDTHGTHMRARWERRGVLGPRKRPSWGVGQRGPGE